MYDFDRVIDRSGTYSCKWDVSDGELPMWVADMDFETAPEIMDALRERLDQGIFGYTDVPDRWRQAYRGWWRDKHGFDMLPEWLVFCTGVVPAISSMVRKLTTPNENVVVMTPVYSIFFNCIVNNGRRPLECPLVNESGRYRMDFDALEACLADRQTSLLLLCNPQNPTGNIWDAETLGRIGEMCAEHGVTVISDEIHCDLTDPGLGYVPFASVSETNRGISVTCVAPTKAFNIAGLQTAAVCVPDPRLRHKVWRALNTDEVAEPNAFAVTGAIAAFERGGQWLDSLREYIFQNKQTVLKFVGRELPGVTVTDSQATYLLWLDVRKYTDDSAALAAEIRRRTGLFLSAGKPFGGDGRYFLRMNIACPRELLTDGLGRLKRGLDRLP